MPRVRAFVLGAAALILVAADCGEDTVVSAGFGTACRTNADCPAGSFCEGEVCRYPKCESDAACNDGVFCNGQEVCAPSNGRADARGCLAGARPCRDGQRCDEAADRCTVPCSIEDDADGDGSAATECGGDDCDDSDPDRYPGATEICDPGGVDEDCDPTTFGDRDADGDGFIDERCCNGDRCGTDCDDFALGVHPTANEVCNRVDDNCDGSVDEGLTVLLYPDADGDGHGAPDGAVLDCPGITAGTSPLDNDCDDENPAIRPGSQRCSEKFGQVLICGADGVEVEVSCPNGGQAICIPQANGTGVCL